MSAIVTDDPTLYPVNVRTLGDGEDVDEANVGVTAQDLANRTAWLKRRVFKGRIDMLRMSAVCSAQNFGACYVRGFDEAWVVGEYGANAQIYKSTNQNASFTREAAIDGVLAGATHFYGIAANANGDLIAVNSSTESYAYDRATATWYDDGWSSPGAFTRIVYLPTVDKFVIVGVSGGNLAGRRTNAADIHNILAPTTQITAGGWSNFTTGLAVNPTTGVVVAAGINAAKPRIAYTTDAGVNWTTLAALAASAITPDLIDVAYGGDGFFYLTVADVVATNTGEIWRSPDGIAWTRVATFAANAIRNLAGFGERLLGATGSGSIVTSIDKGVTWRRCGHVAAGVPLKVENVGGRALILTTTRVDGTADLSDDYIDAAIA